MLKSRRMDSITWSWSTLALCSWALALILWSFNYIALSCQLLFCHLGLRGGMQIFGSYKLVIRIYVLAWLAWRRHTSTTASDERALVSGEYDAEYLEVCAICSVVWLIVMVLLHDQACRRRLLHSKFHSTVQRKPSQAKDSASNIWIKQGAASFLATRSTSLAITTWSSLYRQGRYLCAVEIKQRRISQNWSGV